MTVVRFGTWNVGNAPDAKVAADLASLLRGDTGVWALQECGDRGRMLDALARREPIGVHYGPNPGSSSVPVVWDERRWQATVGNVIPLTPATYAGRVGAGPSTVKAKVLNVVWLRSRLNGRTAAFGSMHMPASLWAPGRARLGRQVIARLLDALDDIDGPVFVGADWNAIPDARILRPLDRARLKSAQQVRPRATHGKRAIDDVRHRGAYRLTAATALVTSSDHRAYATTWSNRR